ncbi:GPR1/FUN34/yaaH family-domain-containing protein [Clohesyomyces aquaticus]|uniref:GPR1/FUN34/yaaH family-domain-containing protein n=1 Tax=Clohesyomyces aquaticus TaxID=1231657 RepID=A0A1Y1ZNW3_9PLEO|nr:GPR1/FUN34/yaaH family-domain-containing protein [Clohesyomyces aquaticus]
MVSVNSINPSPSNGKADTARIDIEKQTTNGGYAPAESPPPKTLGAGVNTRIVKWPDIFANVTVTNVYVANFFFIGAFGLVVTAQWELAIGNGFAYTVFSAFGLFYAGYAAILTPSFGIVDAYKDDTAQLNNALGFFMILWTVFVLTFLVASLPTNFVYISIFFLVDLGFLTVAVSYFSEADGNHAAAVGLKKAGAGFCFVAGLIGWYLTFHLLLKDSLVVL